MTGRPRAGHEVVIRFAGVGLHRGDRAILQGIDWEVRGGERWAVLGPNGSGKTTLLRLAGAELRPSAGVAEVLGRRLGKVDLRLLRADIALVSGAVLRALRPTLSASEVVLTGRDNVREPLWASFDGPDRARAEHLLAEVGLAGRGEASFGVLSEGERQQVLLARALMSEPRLLLLDEPAAGLDLGARERLMTRLGRLAQDPGTAPWVLVTHHVEEIPAGTTHAVLLAGGQLVGAGPVEEVLTGAALSACFRASVAVGHRDGRWSARSDASADLG